MFLLLQKYEASIYGDLGLLFNLENTNKMSIGQMKEYSTHITLYSCLWAMLNAFIWNPRHLTNIILRDVHSHQADVFHLFHFQISMHTFGRILMNGWLRIWEIILNFCHEEPVNSSSDWCISCSYTPRWGLDQGCESVNINALLLNR